MRYYDIDQDGNISYEEFIKGLRQDLEFQLYRDELTERKRTMVQKVFRHLDRNNSGEVTVEDIINNYDVSNIKEFQDKKKSKEELIGEFLMNFEGVQGNRDGRITWEEFNDYYTDMAMSIPSDDYFVQMLEQVWCLAEDEDSAVSKERVKHLIGLIRQRLLIISGNSQEEFTLRKIFKQFDLNNSGTITLDEMTAMLAKIGISAERKYITCLMKVLDTNKTGMLEFEEFATFLLYDPYK